jgi:hypothetical protein
MLFAAFAFATLVGKHWAWGPFVASLVIVAVLVAANALIANRALLSLGPNADQIRNLAERRRVRNRVLVPSFVTFAVAWGVIAGSARSYWPDVFVGAIFLVGGVVLPLAILPMLKRRVRAQQTGERS